MAVFSESSVPNYLKHRTGERTEWKEQYPVIMQISKHSLDFWKIPLWAWKVQQLCSDAFASWKPPWHLSSTANVLSFLTSTQGCGPGSEHSVWPVPGLKEYEAWALLGEPGWEVSAKSKGVMWKDSWKLMLKYDTSRNNFLQAARINALWNKQSFHY